MLLNLMMLLITKHFVVDFLMQPAWMYKNKGKYGHEGGIAHAGLHMVVTYIILIIWSNFNWPLSASLAIFEGIIHYHIDWAKVNINKLKFKKYIFFKGLWNKNDDVKRHIVWIIDKKEWLPNTSEWFWYILGLDQFLHYTTYMVMLYYIAAVIK